MRLYFQTCIHVGAHTHTRPHSFKQELTEKTSTVKYKHASLYFCYSNTVLSSPHLLKHDLKLYKKKKSEKTRYLQKIYFVQTELFFYTTLLKDLKGMHTNKLWRVKKKKPTNSFIRSIYVHIRLTHHF